MSRMTEAQARSEYKGMKIAVVISVVMNLAMMGWLSTYMENVTAGDIASVIISAAFMLAAHAVVVAWAKMRYEDQMVMVRAWEARTAR